jgi:uncharacterized membrane protein
MSLLIVGICLWAAVHLIPSAAPALKQGVVDRLGFNAYRGIFSLALLAALGLIVFGWRSSQPTSIYLPPADLRPIALVVMALAFLCLGASQRPTRIGRIIRHPQLTGLLIWSISHLLTNGDNRSLVLFGGMGAWAVLEMMLISRREGEWKKPDAPAWGKEILGITITLVVMAMVMWGHPWLAGVPLFQ